MNSYFKSGIDAPDPVALHKTDLMPTLLSDGGKASVCIDVAVQVTAEELDEKPKSPLNISATFELPLKKPPERLKSLRNIAEELSKAASRVLVERRTKYDNVKVLSIYWRDGEYPEMKENAEFMGKTFQEDFSYDVTLVELPMENPGSRLLRALGMADELSESAQKNLLILYYCGHGVWDRKGTSLKPHKNASVQLKWEKFQSILTEIDCDILLIFDCCQATAMIIKEQEWKRRCEIIGATNRMDAALADRDKSFTNALKQELQNRASEGIAIDMLYGDLSDMETMRYYNMERQPDYQIHSDRHKWPSAIFLQQQYQMGNDSDESRNRSHSNQDDTKLRSPEQVKDKTDAVMLFAVILEGTHSAPRQEDWNNMINSFSVAPPNTSSVEVSAIPSESYRALMKLVNIPAVFSGSCIIIVAMPVWFYAHLEPNPSYHEIAIVRSDNLWTASPTILAEPYRIPDERKLGLGQFEQRSGSSNLQKSGKSTVAVSQPMAERPPEYEMVAASQKQVLLKDDSDMYKPGELPTLEPEDSELTLEQFRALVGIPQQEVQDTEGSRSPEAEEGRTRNNADNFNVMNAILRPANPFKEVVDSYKRVVDSFKEVIDSIKELIEILNEDSCPSMYMSLIDKERAQWRLHYFAVYTKNICQLLQILIGATLTTIGFTSRFGSFGGNRVPLAVLGAVSMIAAGLTSYMIGNDLSRRSLRYATRIRRLRDELEFQERILRGGVGTVTYQDVLKLWNDYEEIVREEEVMNDPDLWKHPDGSKKLVELNDLKPTQAAAEKPVQGKGTGTDAGHDVSSWRKRSPKQWSSSGRVVFSGDQ